MDDTPEQPEQYEMGMHSTLVKSKNGPYDDQAFVAGWALGTINQRLAATRALQIDKVDYPIGVTNEWLPQLDRIAMAHRYTLVTDGDTGVDGYSFIEFRTPNDPEANL